MKTTKISSLLFAVLLLPVVPVHAEAVSFNLSKVVDKTTPIPDGAGNFACLGNYAISGSTVAFWGSGFRSPFFCEPSGIYLFDGTSLIKVADTNTAIPGGTGLFTTFASPPVISGTHVAFFGRGSEGQEGIYLYDGAAVTKVVDRNTPIPDGTGNFLGFGGDFFLGPHAAISGNNVAFLGFGSEGGGIYLFNGATLIRVADGNTPVPPGGLGNFSGFSSSSVAISSDNVLFEGFPQIFNHSGVYVFDGTSLRMLVDTDTPIPGGAGNFVGVFSDSLVINGDTVAFKASGSAFQVGIYFFDGTTLEKAADANTAIPGGTDTFDDFSYPALGTGRVAFLGISHGMTQGMYQFDGATLTTVADTTTPVPSGVGTFTFPAFAGPPSMSERNVVFTGHDSSGEGSVQLFNGNMLSVVANINTAIPGGSGRFTAFAGQPLVSDGNVAFSARGPGLQEGIYLATHVPISPLTAWLGLKNSDDVGLRVDVLAEVFRNETLIASGQLGDQSTGSSGFNNARLRAIPLSLAGPVEFASGDHLSLRLSVRRTCSGGGHRSGTVRLWYGGAPTDQGKRRDAGSRFDATIGTALNDYFLQSGFVLATAPGSSRSFVEAFVDSSIECSARPFTQFGTWEAVLP